jgi:hypothetical protein
LEKAAARRREGEKVGVSLEERGRESRSKFGGERERK